LQSRRNSPGDYIIGWEFATLGLDVFSNLGRSMELSGCLNYLSIRFDPKAVPYGANPEAREDGSQNFGFKNVKGNAKAASAIPELASDPALKSIVVAISDPKCSFFTIGCLSSDMQEMDGHKVTGYLEFAVNSKKLSTEAQTYFKFFFEFNQFVLQQQFRENVTLNWELRPANFHEVNAHGFTASIVINTHPTSSSLQARRCWNETMGALEAFLTNWQFPTEDPLY
jgi:hypothetical protein